MGRATLAVRRSEFASRRAVSIESLGSAAAAVALSLLCGLAIAYGSILTWVFLAAVVGVVAIPLFSEYRTQALLAWAALSVVALPFVRFPAGQPVVTFDRAWLLGLLAGTIIHARERKQARATRATTILLLALVATYLARAATTGGLTAMKLWLDGIAVPAALFFAGSRLLTTRERVRQLAAALALAGIALALFGFAERMLGLSFASRSGGEVFLDPTVGERISGPLSGPETYALSLVLCFAGTIYLMQVGRERAYLLGSVAVALELGALYFTYFRAAWIAALIVAVMSLGFRPKRFGRLLGILGLIAAIAAVGAGRLESSDSSISARVQNTDNIYTRLATYRKEWDMFKAFPVFGVGVDRFHEVAPAFSSAPVKGVAAQDFPHNSFGGLLVEQGLFGFLPMVGLGIAVAWMLRALRRRARTREDLLLAICVTGAALGYVLMSMTLTLLPYGTSNAFLAVLLAAVAGRLDAVTAERARTG